MFPLWKYISFCLEGYSEINIFIIILAERVLLGFIKIDIKKYCLMIMIFIKECMILRSSKSVVSESRGL